LPEICSVARYPFIQNPKVKLVDYALDLANNLWSLKIQIDGRIDKPLAM